MREQLKFLEGIDRVHTKRKQEQEREKLLKAAKVNISTIGVYLLLVYAYCLCMLIVQCAYFRCMLNVGVCLLSSVLIFSGVCLYSLISEQVKIR